MTHLPPLEMTTVRPLDEKPSDKPRCPDCDSDSLELIGHRCTLIGGGDGSVDSDPNHHWRVFRCENQHQFNRETKSGNVWYTRLPDSEVIKGMPSCFERYAYPCVCGAGHLTARHTKPDGETPAGYLSYKDGKSQHRTFWSCDACGAAREGE